MMDKKIALAITGASGAIYARLLIESLLELKSQWTELAIVMSKNARTVWETELGSKDYANYPVHYYDKYDFNAPFASGSARFTDMLIVPCSMGTLGRIAGGISDDLVTRAADVMLKERRNLILGVRETPYNLIHIRNMEAVTLAGGIICPMTPSYYSQPLTIEQVAMTVVNRLIDLIGLDQQTYRWGSGS
ncbi:UbiX family flavin prenyltransferase [Arachidicoccus ginsenosidivorans]|jgi:4-hydroxy-3-polyprenylbenzoate decarboxylase|uniref:Flavin prenyltransferase UbiX n=1 Tax=Arachidicoccus ginsenosidivorans TaxID=496057 RepID=A0A5B8VIN6_9BACT|nr:UbiX family flavin prenyltransferase [Arachidicoccus ginsenosidivorans]QEC71169.1 UbiX family flavin prenyltransferase [Arachidicoccus ginsenosidivorans]